MNIDMEKIENLIEVLRKHNLEEIELKDKDQSIRLKNTQQIKDTPPSFPGFYYPYAKEQNLSKNEPISSSNEQPFSQKSKNKETNPKKSTASDNTQTILSPFVGTFYGASSPGASNFVSIGTKVKKGDTLCIIEAMKLMNEIEAECDGTVVEILVQEEQPIEFNQALFVIER